MSKPNYSWDASVFLAWLSQEETAPLGDIELVVSEIDAEEATLVVSVTAYAEVLAAKHTDEQMTEFKKFLKRSNVVNADITQIIAERAGRIRSEGLAQGRKIKTPDATYLATASIYKADVLHSLDKGMLALSGLDVVEGLKISLPLPLHGQKGLF
jgi:predicted nucleic acid-binding protein